MVRAESTCWTVIAGAARGSRGARDEFAARYLPAVRAFFRSRWHGTPLSSEVDDAVQETFIDCFREDGALGRVDPDRRGGFRAFLFGIVRNVALRCETRRARRKERVTGNVLAMESVEESEARLSVQFDRAWAMQIMKEAAALMAKRAERGDERLRRHVQLLRLRFEEGLPIREIATKWETDAAVLHREYAAARKEFRAALTDVVVFHHPGSPAEIQRECAALLTCLR